ncbi:6-phosphogluconate dehydrogenase, decarboxylating (Fragment) [Seminavis robusta]|uniref:Multifunctional fusion protein n=1 Tax=Seminavis robusta TaxID=568900 RepID=A0A9N8HI08_9STRA
MVQSCLMDGSQKAHNADRHVGFKASEGDATMENETFDWIRTCCLTVVVVGASGDLAKKKTFPSLLNLYADKLLPEDTVIFGYARSQLTDDELRSRIRPFLEKSDHPKATVEAFLNICQYQGGKSYGDKDAFATLKTRIEEKELGFSKDDKKNRLFYFAIPPNVFGETALAIKDTCIQKDEVGWTRLVVEKPFGRDLESFETLNQTLSVFDEKMLYRIDHYLGKEMVQNLTVLRFSNIWFDKVLNKDNVSCIILTFKEPFGTQGRGGYFDKYGIIRDILQNHLLQVLTLLTMETPVIVEGKGSGKAIRDAKVAVLNAMSVIDLDDVLLGQYDGYTDDDTIDNKDTNTPTFAVIRLRINNPRWDGVPMILKAGKALNERKAEMRIQFKDAPAGDFLFDGQPCPRNELVMRMQPKEAIYMKTNVKSPGFSAKPTQSELEVNYNTRFFGNNETNVNPDAYTRLLLDILQGKQAAFVRDDELRRAWEIFTPVLHRIEQENVRPVVYAQGGRGPKEADDFIYRVAGYIRSEDYVYYDNDVPVKSTVPSPPKPAASPAKDAKAEETAEVGAVPEDQLCDVGLYGLAVMGQNFALNMASHGFRVCVGNRSPAKVDITVERAQKEGDLPLVGSMNPKNFIAHLKKPRKVVILVQAGKPVDDTIGTLATHMEPGDVIIDGGNEWFPNSVRRAKSLEPKGIHFIGMGISGGEEGARNGPSLMPGGPKEAYDMIAPILTKCAAQVEASGSCAGYLGPIGSGNYVKMVHNGIEYGDMQLIAEVYDILKNVGGMTNQEMADLFDEWNKGELESYLIEITSKILRKKDVETGEGEVVDYVLDKTGMKGTGKWTVQEGAEQGVAIPTIAAALDARMLSGRKEEREAASSILNAPTIEKPERQSLIDDVRAAMYASKICSYAQGLSLIKAASDEHTWNVDLAECARLWTGGCIIRAQLLASIQKAFKDDSSLVNLMVDKTFAGLLNDRVPAWRRVVGSCISNGIACPALCASLTYFDSYRRARLPANLTQAQRDFFGAHTYERTDKPGRYHTAWTEGHKDIGDVNQRTEGESVQT